MDRRELLTGSFSEDGIDLKNTSDSMYAYAKLLGSTDAEMVHYCLEGTVFAYLPTGAVPLIGFQTILKHVWSEMDYQSCRYISYENGFFHELDSIVPLQEFQNPVTKKINLLSEIRGGPYNKKITPDQIYWVESGDDIWIQEPNARKGNFTASEEENKNEYAFANSIFRGKLSNLNDASSVSPSVMTYNFVSPWYPFFQMDEVPGKMYWQAVGTKVQSWSDVPDSMQEFLRQKKERFFQSKKPWSERTSTLKHYRNSLKR